MPTLLSNRTTNGAGTGASHSGPCTVWVRGTLGGASVVIQGADADSDANYVKLDKALIPQSTFVEKGCATIHGNGTYFLRAVVSNASASTSITVVTTQ